MELRKITIKTDLEGYLTNRADWNENIAEAIASADNLTLTPAHWHVIYFLRAFYEAYQHTPPLRAFVNALRESAGSEQANSHTLHVLFPKGPPKQASRIAGLPKPTRCI